MLLCSTPNNEEMKNKLIKQNCCISNLLPLVNTANFLTKSSSASLSPQFSVNFLFFTGMVSALTGSEKPHGAPSVASENKNQRGRNLNSYFSLVWSVFCQSYYLKAVNLSMKIGKVGTWGLKIWGGIICCPSAKRLSTVNDVIFLY